jgi:hypothetical protein
MIANDPPSLADAIEFALSILEPFRESSLYDDYQEEGGWTDDQFEAALAVLVAAVDKDEPAPLHCLIVEAVKPPAGIGAQ